MAQARHLKTFLECIGIQMTAVEGSLGEFIRDNPADPATWLMNDLIALEGRIGAMRAQLGADTGGGRSPNSQNGSGAPMPSLAPLAPLSPIPPDRGHLHASLQRGSSCIMPQSRGSSFKMNSVSPVDPTTGSNSVTAGMKALVSTVMLTTGFQQDKSLLPEIPTSYAVLLAKLGIKMMDPKNKYQVGWVRDARA
jgi:hypothetical protein